MANHRLQTSEEISPLAKRRRALSAVAQANVTSEDEDIVIDGMDVCNLIENHTLQQGESATSRALHALGETIRNTLLEVNEIRERNRERRHRELLDVLKMTNYHYEPSHNGPKEMLKTEINSPVYSKEDYLNIPVEKGTKDDIIEENISEDNHPSKTNATYKSENSTTLSQQEIGEMLESTDFAAATNKSSNVSAAHKATAKNSISASPVIVAKVQLNAGKVRQDSKEELKKMRAKMLELQRQKMEDRVRKKWQIQQRLQSND